MVQWLRRRASDAGGAGSNPSWGTKIPRAARPKKKIFFTHISILKIYHAYQHIECSEKFLGKEACC